MSLLKFNNNLFLGSEELKRLQSFCQERSSNLFLTLLSSHFGFTGDEALSFLVTNGSASGTLHVTNPSYAFTSDGQLITWDRDEDIYPSSLTVGTYYWVKISYQNSYLEKGRISLSSNGTLTGTNTLFTDVLRGQPDFPIQIRVYTLSSDGIILTPSISDYTVLDVLSDTSAIVLNPEGIQSITNGFYSIIGTFTEDVPISENIKNIYKYDSCKFEFISSVDTSIPDETVMSNSTTSFYIARVVLQSDGTFVIEDKRSVFSNKFWRLKS